MISIVRRTLSSLTFSSRSTFCQSYAAMKDALRQDLYSIELINKQVNRRLLAMAYTPGVGAVSEAIEQNHAEANQMTLRPRSVAILTDGSFLNASAQGVGPALDWIVAQIKYYSSLSAFPFVVEEGIDLGEALRDLSIAYGTVLYLDSKPLPKIPEDLLVVRHQDVVAKTSTELTEAQKTANLLAYLIKNKRKGLIRPQQFEPGLDFQGENFKTYVPFDRLQKDGKDIYRQALEMHKFYQGKIHIELGFRDIHKLKPLFTEENLRRIAHQHHPYSKTNRLSAIVTDGTSVLGYGQIGPEAGLPVMEGKSLLFKLLGDVDVVPICIHHRDTAQQEVKAICNLAGNFSAINLQDIKAPECFEIEEKLKEMHRLPIFHDDQHGTAIVTLAGLINAAKVVEKDLRECRVLINGAGAAGITIAKLLLRYGVKDIIVCDSRGAIYEGRKDGMNTAKDQIAKITNKRMKSGKLPDVILGMDIFIGVSHEKALRGHWVSKMANKSIVFALANPIPEILPEDAKRAGAMVYGSGRSDFENQINNSLVFPGIFKAISQHRIKVITDEMKIKAAEAIANSIEGQPSKTYIIPDSLDRDVAIRIADKLGSMVQKGIDRAAFMV